MGRENRTLYKEVFNRILIGRKERWKGKNDKEGLDIAGIGGMGYDRRILDGS